MLVVTNSPSNFVHSPSNVVFDRVQRANDTLRVLILDRGFRQANFPIKLLCGRSLVLFPFNYLRTWRGHYFLMLRRWHWTFNLCSCHVTNFSWKSLGWFGIYKVLFTFFWLVVDFTVFSWVLNSLAVRSQICRQFSPRLLRRQSRLVQFQVAHRVPDNLIAKLNVQILWLWGRRELLFED